MRKLFIIVLALSTFAWAHGAKKTDQTRSGAGNDWYQAMLNSQTDHFVRQNQAITSTTAAAAENATFQTPGSMAARQGGEDWYNQKVAIQSDLSRKELNSLKP